MIPGWPSGSVTLLFCVLFLTMISFFMCRSLYVRAVTMSRKAGTMPDELRTRKGCVDSGTGCLAGGYGLTTRQGKPPPLYVPPEPGNAVWFRFLWGLTV